MEDLLSKIPSWIKWIPTVFTGLIIVATVAVRFTETKADDEKVNKIKGILMGILHRFPTLGLNPATKKMQEALMVLSGEKAKETETVVEQKDDKVSNSPA